jgi:hypothetical protein
MSRGSDSSGTSRRQFLVAAGTLAAASPLAAAKIASWPAEAAPPPPHGVTISVSDGKLAYKDSVQPGNAASLYVQPNETVYWLGDTSAVPRSYHVVIRFEGDTPLLDKAGNPVNAIHAANTTVNTITTVDPNAGGCYKYSVILFDETNPSAVAVYTDDPKIIVGRGKAEEILTDVKNSVADLKGTLKSADRALEEINRTLGDLNRTLKAERK